MEKMIRALSAIAILFSLAGQAHAVLSVRVSDGTNSVTATDTDGDGFVNLSTALGSFSSNYLMGSGAPALGTSGYDEIDLLGGNISSGSGDIWVYITQTDLTRSDAHYQIGVGGTTYSSATFEAYLDTTNSAFGQEALLASLGTFSGLGFSGNESGTIGALSAPYSITMVAHIVASGIKQNTTYDMSIRVPEPNSLALLGLGLLGFGFVTRMGKTS
jgi:hypothetical protein